MSVIDSDELTTADRLALIEGDAVWIDAGCELLDADDNLILDISDDLIVSGCSVERNMENTINGTCSLAMSRELVWGSQRVRPYVLLSADGATWYRWLLGVFVLTTPERRSDVSPVTYTVSGFDKLDILNTPLGRSVSVSTSDAVLTVVTDLINTAGELRVGLDMVAAATTGLARVFSVVEDWTTLTVINDLLDSIGYFPLWVDRGGVYRSMPYQSPAERATAWTYSTSSATTTVTADRTMTADFYAAANQIIGINDDPGQSETVPVEGAGIYTASNLDDGPTSINQRGGRVIRRIVSGSYANQAALVAAVTQELDAEKRVTDLLEMSVSPNPVHGHLDVVSYTDPELGVDGRYLVTSWSLPLDGSDMRLSLRGV